jgi:lipid-binding SYLF domain-containing protein
MIPKRDSGMQPAFSTDLSILPAKASGHHKFIRADCVAVIPGFDVVVGVGFGRGFVSCHNADGWSEPGAVILVSTDPDLQLAAGKSILSIEKKLRPKLLSDRFMVGSDASAAWLDGKSVRSDSDAKLLFFGHTKGALTGFGLDGATLKVDDSVNKALYSRPISDSEIVEDHGTRPPVTDAFLVRLSQVTSRWVLTRFP